MPRPLLPTLPFTITAVVGASLGLASSGCESCEFTFGPGVAQTVVTSDVPAIGLRVQVCDQTDDPAAIECSDAQPCGDGFTGDSASCIGADDAGAPADNCEPQTLVEEGGDQFQHVAVPLKCH